MIFDEVQKIYDDEKYVLFWDQIKTLLQREYANIKVFFVSSYTTNEIEAINTPSQLKNAYILQIPFLYCEKDEMDELNNYFNKDQRVKISKIKVNQELKDEIFQFTGGHIGIISESYTNIYNHFRNTTSSLCASVSQEYIFYYFFSNDMQRELKT